MNNHIDYNIEYYYSLLDKTSNVSVAERKPKRIMQIYDNSKYCGQFGQINNDEQYETDKVFIVNGYVKKFDGNFNVPYTFSTINNTSVTLGCQPNDY